MSEFFCITFDKDVIFDDNATNNSTGWTSEKILKEINKHRLTKFEQMEDVDVINKKDKQVIVYSGDTGKFTSVNLDVIGDAAGLSLNQISKMGIVGSKVEPKVVDIPINTLDFKVPKVNILKFHLGDQDVIKTANTFSNSESDDFQEDDMVVFDNTAHLKTQHDALMNYEENIDGLNSYSTKVDKNKFKTINSIETIENGIDNILSLNAAPCDRLLIPTGDLNLSNASNIDYFNVIATNDVKVVCSVDSGTTWKTFKNNSWEYIDLNVDSVELDGIDVSIFNLINDIYWNNLITTNKIRFAYLLKENNTIDELKLQYDGKGYWVEVKDTEYDVAYASNTLMQVKLYFSGDVKINY